MPRDRHVQYVQLTLGPAHLARVRALDAVAGFRCEGVQLAESERTRSYELDAADLELCTTVMTGTYEEIPRTQRIRTACAFIDETRADAVIIDAAADPVQFAMAWQAQRQGALGLTRWAATLTDEPRSRWKEFVKRFVYGRWDGYLTTGTRAEEYLASFGVPDSRVFRCGNPVDVEVLEAIRRERGEAERQDSFLYVGRFLPYKNLENLARAYLRYRAEGGTWSLILVGFGETEPAVREILRAAPDVSFAGHLQLEPLAELYGSCGALVLPSYEPWGLVVDEAMRMGMPVLLAETVGCVPELLAEGRNGFELNGFSEISIAQRLHAMSRCSGEQRRAMSEASLEIIAPHRPEAWGNAVAQALSGIWAGR